MKSRKSKLLAAVGGFTIVELLVAATIAMIAIAAGMEVFINQNKNQIIQSGVTDMQQNGRASMDELVNKVRQAAYRVPPGVRTIFSWDTNPDTIAVAFLKEPPCTATVSIAMPQASSEIRCLNNDLSDFQDGTWGFIYDPTADNGEYFFITEVQVAQKQFQHSLAPLSKAYPIGSQVFLMDYFKYFIDETDTLHPRLMRASYADAPLVYADNIEDLQFEYNMADGSVLDTVTVDRYVREIDIHLVTRTDKNDLFLGQYRRDTLQSKVMVRNLSL